MAAVEAPDGSAEELTTTAPVLTAVTFPFKVESVVSVAAPLGRAEELTVTAPVLQAVTLVFKPDRVVSVAAPVGRETVPLTLTTFHEPLWVTGMALWLEAMATGKLAAIAPCPNTIGELAPSPPASSLIFWNRTPLTSSAATVAPDPGVTAKLSAIYLLLLGT